MATLPPAPPRPTRPRTPATSARLLLLLAVIAPLALAGCSKSTDTGISAAPAGTDSAARSTTTDPLADVAPAGGPAVGICRPALPAVERRAAYERRPAVRCDQPHGGEVVASFDLPKAIAAAITPALIRAGGAPFGRALGQTGTTCNGPANDAIQQIVDIDLTGTPFSAAFQATNLSGSYFVPAPDEWAAGERWLVCEVTAVDPDGTSVPYTGTLNDLGHGRLLPGELGACVDDKLAFVHCAGTADRAVASADVQATKAPGRAEALAGCTTLVERLGAKLTGDRPLRTEVSAVAPGTFAVFCLLPGPAPVPR